MNKAYHNTFIKNKLTLGVLLPIESYSGDIPQMKDQLDLITKVEKAGFSALWTRDIPLHDPNFGDVGQMYDPLNYLSFLASHTTNISLGVASLILPFRHPITLAKSINTVNNLSKGRLLLGIASGDRVLEYQAFNVDYESRGETFRESFSFLTRLLDEDFPHINSSLGQVSRANLLPKSSYGKIPLLITGHSQQSLSYIAKYSDAWMYYHQEPKFQEKRIIQWKEAVGEIEDSKFKPFVQSLYIDLLPQPDAEAIPMHLGYRLGVNKLLILLQNLEKIGVNHVILNFKYGSRDIGDVLAELAQALKPYLKSY